MNLKLSYRDKVIFIVVMVILVLVAGFFLLIKPRFEAVSVAKANLETKQQEKNDIDAKIGTLPDIIDSIKAIAEEVEEKQNIFFDEAHPYVNETYLREALSETRADITTMNTEYTQAANIDWYAVEAKNILAYANKMNADLYNELPQEVYDEYNGVQPEGYPSTVVGVTSVNLSFKNDDDYRTMYSLIDRLAEDEKTVVINSVSTGERSSNTANSNDEEISVSLTMYSVFPLNVEQVLKETPEVKPIEQTADAAAETTAAE